MTVNEVIEAFKEFVLLFPEETRRQVFDSKGYTEWARKNYWIVLAKDDENITTDR